MNGLGSATLGRGPALLALLLLASCDAPADKPVAKPFLTQLPAQLCAQASKSLASLDESGTFEHDGKGGAIIQEQAWMALAEEGQDQLARAIAVDAACTAKSAPSEFQIDVRGETGRSLTNRVVEIVPNMDAVLDDDSN